jgi:hypothetical protein
MLVDFFQSPSETQSQFLLGLSRIRLATGAFLTLLLALSIGALLWVCLKPSPWRKRYEKKLLGWVGDYSVIIYGTLSITALATATLLLLMIPPIIQAFIFLEPITARLTGPILWAFFSSSLSIVLFRLKYAGSIQRSKTLRAIDRFLGLAGVFLTVFFLYEHILIWTGAANQSRYSYWNLLADEFLKGRLHLENPPHTHDLTLYQGKWYVPMPPLPAILMMPLAILLGGENINTSNFSIIFSALNAVLLTLIFEQLARRGWVKLSRVAILLLVLLVMFGTPHLWVGIRGRAWFVSQIVTVTFLALAVLAALRSWSPWLVGISLGAAIATRPNVIMTWAFAFAIAMQILKDKRDSPGLKQITDWSIRTIIPVGVAIGGLLFYNFARFENPFDFGYATINGDPAIVANAQNYGIFSIRFALRNLSAMLFDLPAIRPGTQWPIEPSTTGMSIFLATPPLIYLFRRYEKRWWIWGAWTSVSFNFILLVLYHNTGAHQFGYRYILDAIVPLIALLAVALEGKITWYFVLLVLISMAVNIYGTLWFISG